MNGDAELALTKRFDADDFADVFAVHRVIGGGVGKGDEHAHSFIVFVEAGVERDARTGGVDTRGHILKVVVPALGGSNANRPGEFGPGFLAPFWFVHELPCAVIHYRPGSLYRQASAANLIRREGCAGVERGRMPPWKRRARAKPSGRSSFRRINTT